MADVRKEPTNFGDVWKGVVEVCDKREIEILREEFERLRREKIEAVAHKHKDDPLCFDGCYKHLMAEVRELDTARKYLLITGDDDGLLKRIEEELIDIANCAEFTFIALRKHQDHTKGAR